MLYIFVVILLMMLLGCVILSLNLSNILEKVVIYILLFWEKRAIRSLVLKNFVAHKLRNQKTTLMYAVCLAFIVFSSVSWEIQLRTFLYQQQQLNGCLLKVTSDAQITNTTSLEEYPQNTMKFSKRWMISLEGAWRIWRHLSKAKGIYSLCFGKMAPNTPCSFQGSTSVPDHYFGDCSLDYTTQVYITDML
jgi:hypothetical protein